MHKQDQLTLSGICDSQGPKLHTVIELPTVDILHSVFGGVGTYSSQVEAHCADVEESKLVNYLALVSDELNEAVLANDQFVLDVVGTTSGFTSSSKFIVHSFHSRLVKSLNCLRHLGLVSLSGEQVFECDKS